VVTVRRLTCLGALVALVVVVRQVAGVWVAAGLVALAAMAGLIAVLAAIDAWLDRSRNAHSAAVVVPPGSDHLAFARALAAVADAYLTECEREANRHG
jgi:hypothetical protein